MSFPKGSTGVVMDVLQTLTREFNLNRKHVENIVSLIDEGSTIPFIARYRKEQTGSCDDQVLREVFDRLTYLRNLEKRKEEVIQSISSQEKMTDELMVAINAAETLAVVEDLYRPFKQKRRTRQRLPVRKAWSRWRISFFPKMSDPVIWSNLSHPSSTAKKALSMHRTR